MRGHMLILEKPITPEEFDSLIECDRLKLAASLIESLNRVLQDRKLTLKWGSRPEPDEVIAVVNDHYRKFGWDGITQHMITSNNTREMTKDEMEEGTIPGKVIITVRRERSDELKT